MAKENEKAEEAAEAKADPLHEARERYARAKEAWREDRKRYVEDVKFLAGAQWPTSIVDQREKDNRPVLVVDKLNQYIRQVVNDSRQNRPSIKVRPVDDNADVETANIMQGLVRHIEDRSSADVAYDTAVECQVKGGFGFIRVLTEYAHDATFDQELAIRRVRNPLTVTFDPDAKEPDGSDAKFCFVSEEISEDEYEELYPDAQKVNWEADEKHQEDWKQEETVTIAEYWWAETRNKRMHLLEDGTTVSDEEYQAAKAEGLNPPAPKESRDIPSRVIKYAKINGKDYLEGPRDWPGKWIPIVPVWGNEIDIEGKVIHTGMIHAAKDAQRLYNYSRSAFAERVALTPKSPFIAAAGQVENYQDDWEQANTRNIGVLKYDPMDVAGNPVPPPQRQPAADIPSGFAQDMQMSEHDIQAALGMYNASLGAQSNEKSGKAILARQREGDVATFHYHDNLARAIRHVGRIIVDLIPKIYDSTRTIRILGIDGKADTAKIDPMLPVAKQKIGSSSIYNLGVGTYDVAVDVGPSYTTRRQEAADEMVELTRGNPALFPLVGDLMINSMDWPNADEIARRLKIMLPPQIAQVENAEGAESPEVQAIVQQAQEALSRKDEAIGAATQHIEIMQQAIAEMQKAQAEKMAELELKAREISIKEYEAETKRAQVLAPAFTAEQIQALVVQTIQDLFTNQGGGYEAQIAHEIPQEPPLEGGPMGDEYIAPV